MSPKAIAPRVIGAALLAIVLAASLAYGQLKISTELDAEDKSVIEHVRRLCRTACVVVTKEEDDATVQRLKELERQLTERECS